MYDDAVEEALCFGWIDSIIKRIDDERFVRIFTPRKSGSRWSTSNKKLIEKLEGQGLLSEAGMARVDEARESGLWETSEPPRLYPDLTGGLKRALAKNETAKIFFDQLAPSYR